MASFLYSIVLLIKTVCDIISLNILVVGGVILWYVQKKIIKLFL